MKKLLFLLTAAAVLQVSQTAHAIILTQNFDSMGTAGTATPAGWTNGPYTTVQQNIATPGSAPTNVTLFVDDGTDITKGRSYNYGTTGNGDRALGNVATTGTTGDRAMQWTVTNSTANTIDSFNLTYDGEQWLRWDSVASNLLVFASPLTGSGFVALPAGTTFTQPQTGTSLALDGNAAANRVAGLTSGSVTFASLGLANLAPGGTFFLTWHDRNDAGNDAGLAIDNVSLNLHEVIVPEPSSFVLAGFALVGLVAAIRRRKA